MKLASRDYTQIGFTQSLCPECLALVPAKIINRGGRVYFRKRCSVHGVREDFVSSDAAWFDRGPSAPAKLPLGFGVEPSRGCPFDCGLCTEHEQHTCIGLLEITSACNLKCPMCFAASGPGGVHLSVEDCRRAIDRLVELEGQAEVLQLSGGEPTIHPQFAEIFHYACESAIDIVMVNTNGLRIARDEAFVESLADYRHRSEIYLQFDGFDEAGAELLRGEPLVEEKLRAIKRLGEAGLRTILVCTLQAGVNEHEIGAIVDFAAERPWITGVSFQPATYTGRYVLPDELERRVTFPDVIKAVAEQSTGDWLERDFTPLPCAHPNAHTLSYAFRHEQSVVPVTRFVEIDRHLDLLSGRITFTRPQARELIGQYLSRQCCPSGECGDGVQLTQIPAREEASLDRRLTAAASEFFERALSEKLDPEDMFRVTTTSFMDAYNFDVRQLMRSCVHHVLPSGHLIPFSAYNVLYRDGHVPLPELQTSAERRAGMSLAKAQRRKEDVSASEQVQAGDG